MGEPRQQNSTAGRPLRHDRVGADEGQTWGEPVAQDEEAPEKSLRADARRNRDRIVEAARSVFAEQGGDASMEAIAKRAGVGVGTLYRHFPKRVDVVEALWRQDVEELLRLATATDETVEPWLALVTWLEANMVYARSKRIFLNELNEAFQKNPDLKLLSRERMSTALDQILKRAQDAGSARRDVDGDDVMQLVSSMCTSASLKEGQADRLMSMVLDGLRPPQ